MIQGNYHGTAFEHLLKEADMDNVIDLASSTCTSGSVSTGSSTSRNEDCTAQEWHLPVQCTDDIKEWWDMPVHPHKHFDVKSTFFQLMVDTPSECSKFSFWKDSEITKEVSRKKVQETPNESSELLDISVYLKNPFKQKTYYKDFQVYMMQQETVVNNKSRWPEKFNSELLRLSTYASFPSTPVSFVSKFCQEGFIYQSETNSIICVFCDLKLPVSELIGVNVSSEHKNRSSKCPIVTGAKCENKPVPTASWPSHGSTRSSYGSTNSSSEKCVLGHFPITRTVMEEGTARAENQSENLPRSTLASTPNDAQSGAVSTVSEQTVAGETSEKTDTSKKKPLTYAELGIFAEKPKRSDMAVLQKRVSSFDDKWNNSHTQTPKMLAEAGMYFAGYADCARCFFCGGGLKNWEPQDNPWIEHARWFPKCSYVRLVKGPEFVVIVQEKNKSKQEISLQEVEEEQKKRAPHCEPVLNIAAASVNISPVAVDEKMSADNDADLEKLEAENEELKTQTQCKICMDAESSVVFLPCGHLVSCSQCAHALKQCPLCRTDIKGSVRAHLS